MKTFGDVRAWLSDDRVGTAELARPPDNFFDVELIASLADAYAWLDAQAGGRGGGPSPEGKHFCPRARVCRPSWPSPPRPGGARERYGGRAARRREPTSDAALA